MCVTFQLTIHLKGMVTYGYYGWRTQTQTIYSEDEPLNLHKIKITIQRNQRRKCCTLFLKIS